MRKCFYCKFPDINAKLLHKLKIYVGICAVKTSICAKGKIALAYLNKQVGMEIVAVKGYTDIKSSKCKIKESKLADCKMW